MKKINRETAKQYIDKSSGKIFSAVFIKKNGEKRKMNCRTGVHKFVKGIGLKFNPKEKSLIGVFDMQKHGYRFINLVTLERLKINGYEYSIQTETKQRKEIHL